MRDNMVIITLLLLLVMFVPITQIDLPSVVEEFEIVSLADNQGFYINGNILKVNGHEEFVYNMTIKTGENDFKPVREVADTVTLHVSDDKPVIRYTYKRVAYQHILEKWFTDRDLAFYDKNAGKGNVSSIDIYVPENAIYNELELDNN